MLWKFVQLQRKQGERGLQLMRGIGGKGFLARGMSRKLQDEVVDRRHIGPEFRRQGLDRGLVGLQGARRETDLPCCRAKLALKVAYDKEGADPEEGQKHTHRQHHMVEDLVQGLCR